MKITKAVIPAAGWGTRMLPFTKSVAKEMLPILNKPLIQFAVEEAVASGIEDIVIVSGRHKAPLEDYFDYCPELEDKLLSAGMAREAGQLRWIADCANIIFVRQKEIKGLGHAVLKAKSIIGDHAFALLLPDDIMMSDVPVTRQLTALAQERNANVLGIKTVLPDRISLYSSLKLESRGENIFRVLNMIEKPPLEKAFSNYAIMGRYILTPMIFDILEEIPPGYNGEIQLTDALNLLRQEEMMLALDFKGRRYDSGNLRGFLEATIDFALKDQDISPWFKELLLEKAQKLEEN